MKRLEKQLEPTKFKYKDSNITIPLNLYFDDKYHKEFIEVINDKFTTRDFVKFITQDIPYGHFLSTTYSCKDYPKGQYSIGSRRSITDLLGVYFTYFPERFTEEYITQFLKVIKYYTFNKGGETKRLIGHYCNEPKKVVLLSKNSKADCRLSAAIDREASPLTRIPFIMEDGKRDEMYDTLMTFTGSEDASELKEHLEDTVHYAIVDTMSEMSDGFIYSDLQGYFEEL